MKTAPCRECQATWHTKSYHSVKQRKPMNRGTSVFKVHCQYCDSNKHTKGTCPERLTKKDLATINPKTGRYPDIKLRNTGKYGQKWAATRREWHKLNPPDHTGHHYCHYCGVAMAVNETTLDHLQSRTRHPELRFELSNLVPCCSPDNTAKGSKSHDEYCLRCVK